MIKLQITVQLLTPKGLPGCTLDCLHIYQHFLGSGVNNGALTVFKATVCLFTASVSKVLIPTCNTLLDKTGHFRIHTGHSMPNWYSKGVFRKFSREGGAKKSQFPGKHFALTILNFHPSISHTLLELLKEWKKIKFVPNHSNNCEMWRMRTDISSLVHQTTWLTRAQGYLSVLGVPSVPWDESGREVLQSHPTFSSA